MPLTSGDGDVLTSGGDRLEPATFGVGDALWLYFRNFAVNTILDWVADGFLTFDGPVVDLGSLAGPVRFQRYHFSGLSVTLQYSSDGEEWHNGPTAGFGLEDLTNYLNLVDWLVDLAYGLGMAAVERFDAAYTVAGVVYAELGAPMTAIAVGNVKKLVLSLTQGSEPLNLSFYFRKTDAPSGSTGEADLIGDFRTNAEPALLDCMSADVAINQYRVEDRISAGVTNGHLRTFIGEVLSGVVGTAAAADTSNIYQAAGCLSWYTNFSGRGERGRTFIPGLPAVFVDNGLLQAGAIAAYQTFADAMIANYDGDTDAADWQFVLWRSHVSGAGAVEGNPPAGQEGHVNPATQPPFNPLAAAHGITLGVPQQTVRTLRRRGVGVRIGRRTGG